MINVEFTRVIMEIKGRAYTMEPKLWGALHVMVLMLAEVSHGDILGDTRWNICGEDIMEMEMMSNLVKDVIDDPERKGMGGIRKQQVCLKQCLVCEVY